MSFHRGYCVKESKGDSMKINFTKMEGCGNDYIYINCIDNAATNGREIKSPESLAVFLSDRHFGVGEMVLSNLAL